MQRPTAAVLAAILLIVALFGFYRATTLGFTQWGMDFAVYWDAFHRWMAGGSYFEPWQLAGPYWVHGQDAELAVLMPPTFIPVVAPFALLPRDVAGLMWVILPVVVLGWAIYRMRPPAWSWPILALLVAWPHTGVLIAIGNPTMAASAILAVALATNRRWLAALVLLKPTLGPFALVGIRDRRWWLAAAVLVAASLPFGGLWLDWWTAVSNAQDGGVLYSFPHLPAMVLPLAAFAASRSRRWSGRIASPLPLPASPGS